MADRFEARLDQLFRDYAAGGVRPIDRFAIAQAIVEAGVPSRPWPVPTWRPLRQRRWSIARTLAVAMLAGLALLAGLLFGVGHTTPPPLATDGPSRGVASPAPPSDPRPSIVRGPGGTIIVPVNSADANGSAMHYFAVGVDGGIGPLDIVGHSRSCPTFSPDGQSLAYISFPGTQGPEREEQLVISKPDGSDPQIQWRGHFNVQTFHQVVWSPNSEFVAATHAVKDPPGTGDQIVIGRRGASSATTLDLGTGETQASIAWSPDGRQLAAIVSTDATTQRIEVVDLVGGPPHTIVTAPSIHSTAWSPDGSTIAYTTASWNTDLVPDAGDLYLIAPDGSNLRQIAPGSPESEDLAIWSPDGSLLAVTARGGSALTGTFTTIIYDATGTELHRLTIPMSSNLFMTWSPDSRSLLFSLGGGGDIGPGGVPMEPTIFPVDGSASHRLASAPSDYYTQCPLTWAVIPQ
jgi:hypothetical protein